MQGSLYSQSAVNTVMSNTDYLNFSNDVEEGPHDIIHNVIAGDMAAAFSPNDALFFLHHQQIDRLWAQWQGRNATRLQDYAGNTVQGQGPTDGSRFPLAKLTDKLPMQGIRGMADITVAEVMDTMSDKLCYVVSMLAINVSLLRLISSCAVRQVKNGVGVNVLGGPGEDYWREIPVETFYLDLLSGLWVFVVALGSVANRCSSPIGTIYALDEHRASITG